jgi:hypothetical protein
MSKPRKSTETTSNASEFFVAATLWRLGLPCSVTFGNHKQVDIVFEARGGFGKINVKGVRLRGKGDKWGIGNTDYSQAHDLYFALLRWPDLENVATLPEVFIVPGIEAERVKQQWHDKSGLYFDTPEIQAGKDSWGLLLDHHQHGLTR